MSGIVSVIGATHNEMMGQAMSGIEDSRLNLYCHNILANIAGHAVPHQAQ